MALALCFYYEFLEEFSDKCYVGDVWACNKNDEKCFTSGWFWSKM